MTDINTANLCDYLRALAKGLEQPLDQNACTLAADVIERQARSLSETHSALDAEREKNDDMMRKLRDPAAVHANMLRGIIARITPLQAAHIESNGAVERFQQMEKNAAYAEGLQRAALDAWYEWRDGLDEDATVSSDSHWVVLETLLTEPCEACDGHGRQPDGDCEVCKGFARMPKSAPNETESSSQDTSEAK